MRDSTRGDLSARRGRALHPRGEARTSRATVWYGPGCMLVRRALAMLSFAGIASWSGLARAQYFDVAPTVRATGGYNYNAIISDLPGSKAVIQSGPLLTLAPSLTIAYDTPRVTQLLTLTSVLGLPLTNEGFDFSKQPPTASFKSNYVGNVPIDERTPFNFTFGASASPVNGLSAQPDSSLTPLNAPPGDLSYNLALTGSEMIQRELTEELVVSESSNVFYNVPFSADSGRPSTLTVRNSLSASRKWPLDTLTLTIGSGVTRFGRGETSGVVSEPRVQILNDLTVTWMRPLTDDLTSTVNAGVSQTLNPGTPIEPAWSPAGGATLTYNLAPVMITLAYNYSSQVDIYAADTRVTNQVSLRAVLPIWYTGLTLTGTGGVVHSVPSGEAGQGLDSFTSDLSLAYTPPAIPKLLVSVRGIFARQVPSDFPLNATSRYGLIFNVGFAYPSAHAADVVARLAPAYIPSASPDGDTLFTQEGPAPELQAPFDSKSGPAAPAAPFAPAPKP